MNNHSEPIARLQFRMDQFGARLAHHLDGGLQTVPRDVGERLRAARAQALGHRRTVALEHVAAVVTQGGVATVHAGLGFWGRLSFVLPLIALTVGLLGIGSLQEQLRDSELAEVDAELLTGDLPPSAYTDPGFAQFLKLDLKN